MRPYMNPQAFPSDPGLPQLRIAGDPGLMPEVFQRHLQPLAGKAYHIQDCILSRIRYRRAARWILRYTLHLVELDTGRDPGRAGQRRSGGEDLVRERHVEHDSKALTPPSPQKGGHIGQGKRQGVRMIVFAMLLAISLVLQGRASAAQPATEAVTPPAFDPGAPPETRTVVAPFLTFGGRLELEYQLEKNFDLDNSDDDELSTVEPKLSLAFSFDPSRHVQVYLNVGLLREIALTEGRDRSERERRVRLELKHAFVLFKDLFDGRFSLQVGRQRFRDDREWLYDDELDAVRAFYRVAKLSLELSVSRKNLVDRDLLHGEDKERINNYFLYGRYALTEKVAIAAYTFFRDDHSSERERPIFFGLQSKGEIVDDLEYWLELAHARGKDGSKRIRGWGLDLGATYEFDQPLRPSMTVGYAFGTGDGDPNDRVDRSFRQTGLQGNEDKFNGVTRFKYYGELFDPELSNLSIFTGGFGIRPTRRSSIDLVYHYYLQHKASDTIREAEIDEDPTGRSRRLGSEIDLIVGYREIRNVDIKLLLGYFIPGKAFPSGADNAFFANLEIRYHF